MTKPARGRPLRFLLVVMLCWSGARLAQSLDFGMARPLQATVAHADHPPPSAAPTPRRTASVAPGPIGAPTVSYGRPLPPHVTPAMAGAHGMAALLPTLSPPAPALPAPSLVASSLAAESHGYAAGKGPASLDRGTAHDGTGALAGFPPGLGFPRRARSGASDRWQLSIWALWRPGMDGHANAGTGRLGASQAGMRIDRELLAGGAGGGRLTGYARLSRAFVQPASPEAALGIALQPVRAVPFTIGIERRIALGTGDRDAMAIMGAAGIGPLALPGRIALDGYAQAGMVGARSRDAFGDGRLSLLRPVGDGRIALGLGLSGGAQPQVARLDFGPELRAKLKVAGGTLRLDAGWRTRIAGNARPGSGPAITLASNF
ncbi:hypothetical protein [Sphingobium aquiterrae]|uniref:hypothetical protein n=1 Tax=Sphingobium aquiterrae TaxID=2038656 RepID=UPI003017DA03